MDKIRSNALLFFGFIVILVSSCSIFKPTNTYQLTWADEFNIAGYPDTTKWSYDLGDGCPMVCNWGNAELQYYTNGLKNAKIENGNLIITAIMENLYKYEFTSARIKSKFKGDWTYGKVEVRAKLPKGKGTWPAIWLLPTDWTYGDWPKSGEIDLMEHVGYIPDSIFASAHTELYRNALGTQNTKSIFLPDAESNYHVYGMEWDKNKIIMTVDGKKYFKLDNNHEGYKTWPFDKRFHIILNIAVGGHWGGSKGVDRDIWPQKMEIDYVRIFTKK